MYSTRGTNKYAAEVGYRGPTYHTIYVIRYGELPQMNLFA